MLVLLGISLLKIQDSTVLRILIVKRCPNLNCVSSDFFFILIAIKQIKLSLLVKNAFKFMKVKQCNVTERFLLQVQKSCTINSNQGENLWC